MAQNVISAAGDEDRNKKPSNLESKTSESGSLAEATISTKKDSTVSYPNIGALNSIQSQRLGEHAKAMGLGPNEAARKFVLDAIAKPVVSQAENESSQSKQAPTIKCNRKELVISKQKQERYYLELSLTQIQATYVSYWNLLLKSFCDRQQLQLLPIKNNLIPCCLY